MKAALRHFISAALLLAACSTTPQPVDFAGRYRGAATDRSYPYGESLVEELEISDKAGSYSLTGFMNDTNREPGMDHTSNTRWHWTGTGATRGDALQFTYSDAQGSGGTGSLRQERTGLVLTLDRTQYRLQRSPP